MPKYIDVEELLRKPPDIHDYYDESGNRDSSHGYSVATIKAAPTISPDEVRGAGEWLTEYEPNGRPYQFHCSVCDSDFSQMGITHASNYCPSCGARMKGAEDETTD